MKIFGRTSRWPWSLHHRLFLLLGVTITITGFSTAFIQDLINPDGPASLRGAARFVANRLSVVWDQPGQLITLSKELTHETDVSLRIDDAANRRLVTIGDRCDHAISTPVARNHTTLGYLTLCIDPPPAVGLIPSLLMAGFVLWAAAGKIAQRMTRPLLDVMRVAQDIGLGQLESRAHITDADAYEVSVLGHAVNDMASKIERQMTDRQTLLAVTSHELRTPLTRLRVLVELVKENSASAQALEHMILEIAEIDTLVSQLLASSKLDFEALRLQLLEVSDMAYRALERAGCDVKALQIEAGLEQVYADASLLARALANIIENSKKHGGGLQCLRIRTDPAYHDQIFMEVIDCGEGFDDDTAARIFQAPYQGPGAAQRDATSLGLGLMLVQRIAEAHGGHAYARNVAGGGACVGFSMATQRARMRQLNART